MTADHGRAPAWGLAVAGYFDMLSGHFRSLLWNQSIPDDVRGRMAGIELLSYSIGPLLGQVRSSTAAAHPDWPVWADQGSFKLIERPASEKQP